MLKDSEICCCGPKIWTWVIGWFQLVFTVLVGLGVTAVIFVGLTDAPEGKIDNRSATVGVVAMWLVIGLCAVINALLLFGNERERTGFLWPWLICQWIGTVSTGLSAIGALLSGQLLAFPAFAVQLVLGGFCVYVVHQRRNEILASEKMGMNPNNFAKC